MASCTTRIAFLLVSVWSMAQGAGYLIAAILGMRAYDCAFDMSVTQVKYFIHLLYFRHEGCGNSTIDWDALQIYPSPEVDIHLPVITEAVERTQVILMVYLITSILWIVTSIMLIVAVFSPCMGRTAFKCFIYPWALVCLFILLQDVAATYFHVVDMIDTWDVSGLIEFLGIPYEPEYYFYFNAIPQHILVLPALMMSLLSSRAVIGWFINLSIFIYMCIRIHRIKRKPLTPGIVSDQPISATTATQPTAPYSQQVVIPQNPMVQQQSLQQTAIYPSLSSMNEPGPSGVKA
ncbi:uncharacterized protein LOC132259162 [Phlebotomus argentipes]|uniref:uncharacterized protein LOC132259162 n=1 Tax=Phlebotomus argentipes TaxID=94469 RepID=UPI0028932419|nr:uncharacterized protein LOC132259162 [Phlebotomus argentipes]